MTPIQLIGFNLGNAAERDVGTTSGTVAAGDDSRIVGAVQTSRALTAGAGVATIGDLSADRTIALNSASITSLALADTSVQPARSVSSGTGLTGGGSLAADRTVSLSAGSLASLALADTSVQPARSVSAGTGLTGGGSMAADRTIALSAGSIASLALADNAFVGLDAAAQTSDSKTRVSSMAKQDLTAVADQGVGSDANNLVPYAAFGTKLYEYVKRTATHIGASLASRGLFVKTIGSGAFGPASADVGHIISMEKVDSFDGSGNPVGSYLTATGEGEMEPLWLISRQGRKGDGSTFIFDSSKVVTGTGADNGGVVGGEVRLSTVNASGVTQRAMHNLPGIISHISNFDSGQGIGHFVEFRKGAFFSGLHVGNTLVSDGEAYEGANSLTYIVSYADARALARIKAALDINGTLYQGYPDNRRATSYDSATGIWAVKDETGAVMVQALENELSWSGSAWTSSSAAVTSSTGTITTSSGTVRLKKAGKSAFIQSSAVITTNGTGATLLQVALPITPAGTTSRKYILTGQRVTDGKAVTAVCYGSIATAYVTLYDGTYPAVSGAEIVLSGVIEHADA